MTDSDRKTALMVTGIVLKSAPAGEYDRRVVLLTKESGKLSCFARGARRQGSTLMAAGPFAFGRFRLAAGRTSYILTDAEIDNYFADLRNDIMTAYHGMYFLEIAEYITRENNDEAMVLALLYMALRALEKKAMPERLIRTVYELKTVAIEGEYPEITEETEGRLDPSTVYALRFIAESPLEKLFSFRVSERVQKELEDYAAGVCGSFFGGHAFESLAVIRTMSYNQ